MQLPRVLEDRCGQSESARKAQCGEIPCRRDQFSGYGDGKVGVCSACEANLRRCLWRGDCPRGGGEGEELPSGVKRYCSVFEPPTETLTEQPYSFQPRLPDVRPARRSVNPSRCTMSKKSTLVTSRERLHASLFRVLDALAPASAPEREALAVHELLHGEVAQALSQVAFKVRSRCVLRVSRQENRVVPRATLQARTSKSVYRHQRHKHENLPTRCGPSFEQRGEYLPYLPPCDTGSRSRACGGPGSSRRCRQKWWAEGWRRWEGARAIRVGESRSKTN